MSRVNVPLFLAHQSATPCPTLSHTVLSLPHRRTLTGSLCALTTAATAWVFFAAVLSDTPAPLWSFLLTPSLLTPLLLTASLLTLLEWHKCDAEVAGPQGQGGLHLGGGGQLLNQLLQAHTQKQQQTQQQTKQQSQQQIHTGRQSVKA